MTTTVMAQVVTRPASIHKSDSSLSHHHASTSTPRTVPSHAPNKHLPYCPPGPKPSSRRRSSPPGPSHLAGTSSLLSPPDAYPRLLTKPSVYALNGQQLHAALDHIASQPLPDPELVFPWLHGLHQDNALQLAFFLAKKRTSRRVPRCIRSITLVKVGGDLSHSKLKGAVSPSELLVAGKQSTECQFLDSDPRDGYSVRNFQIQTAKMATLSDIVVYGDTGASRTDIKDLAERIARAQKCWRLRDLEAGVDRPMFNTFILTDPFAEIEEHHPEIVAIGSNSCLTGNVMDFYHRERLEMHRMSTASEIAPNVWLGPSPDLELDDHLRTAADERNPLPYDMLIECSESAQLPTRTTFRMLERLLDEPRDVLTVPQLDFPGSGSMIPPTWSQAEADALMTSIVWIHKQANPNDANAEISPVSEGRKRKDSRIDIPERDPDGDITMCLATTVAKGRRFLIHCSDGYTETTLLAVAYYMYANCVPMHEAYLRLHKHHKRNFFAYQTDVALLTTIQPRILQASPARKDISSTVLAPSSPPWVAKMDGSLPCRIMDYMYLGNLIHANNPELLRELGIGQVLSVGQPIDWAEDERRAFCRDDPEGPWDYTHDNGGRYLYINGVQDNGVDPLTIEFQRCLAFIRQGRARGTATLVHCRVGVSRSATICIAETMNELNISFPAAYCFVRARRLNVIIQPHLRFSYELLKYEEDVHARRSAGSQKQAPHKRELEWAWIAREIAGMNQPYSRQ